MTIPTPRELPRSAPPRGLAAAVATILVVAATAPAAAATAWLAGRRYDVDPPTPGATYPPPMVTVWRSAAARTACTERSDACSAGRLTQLVHGTDVDLRPPAKACGDLVTIAVEGGDGCVSRSNVVSAPPLPAGRGSWVMIVDVGRAGAQEGLAPIQRVASYPTRADCEAYRGWVERELDDQGDREAREGARLVRHGRCVPDDLLD